MKNISLRLPWQRTPHHLRKTDVVGASRKRVGRPGDIEFYDPRSTGSSTIVKTKSLVRFMPLAILLAALVRVVFMKAGVLDYIQMEKSLAQHAVMLESIKEENQELQIEIKKIMNDKAYQKQVVREHLGVIAKDEFLILFATETAKNSSATGSSSLDF